MTSPGITDPLFVQLAEALRMWDSDRAGLIAEIVLPTVRRIVANELLDQANAISECGNGCYDPLVDRAEELDGEHCYARAAEHPRI